MLLLLNQTIKPLNQFAKEIQKKSLFLGLLLTIFFIVFNKIFSQKSFFWYNCFGLIQQTIDRDGSNITGKRSYCRREI